MEIKESVRKYLVFSSEDKQIVDQAMTNLYGDITIRSIMAGSGGNWNHRFFLPLLSAYGKIIGTLPSDLVGHVKLTSDEASCMCSMLRSEYKNEERDKEYRDKILPILEAIFDN